MRELSAKLISDTVKALCIKANFELSDEMSESFLEALKKEKSANGRELLNQLLKNAEIARKERYPICQDTGIATLFLELGQDLHIIGGDLNKAINEGVAAGYREGYLRKSVVADPLKRKNTGTNTPAVIHTDIVPGDKLKITFMAKGGGCENVSRYMMFRPTSDKKDIEKFVVETVEGAGANPCPPVIVGVGMGCNLEGSALLAKRALLRKIKSHNEDKDIAKMEKELLDLINRTGIGPGGMGGTVTALAVHIESAPCHIASFPVTVSIDCHAHRVQEAVL